MRCLLLSLLLWAVEVPAALAHAVLLETRPSADAVLADPPAEVVLRFSEPVEPVAVRLFDASGGSVAQESAVRDTEIVVPLPPLGDGTYILSWRVASADSHPVGGAFRFAVGEAVDPAEPIQARQADWTSVAVVHRAAYLAVLLFSTGIAAFIAGSDGRMRDVVPVLRRGGALLLLGAAVLALGLLPLQGGLLLGAPLGQASLGDLLAPGWRSPVARGGLASALLLVLAAVSIGHRPRIAAAASLGAVLMLGCSGHAATADPRWLSAPSLSLHAGLAALWAGALLPLRIGLVRLPAREAASVLRAFSRLAVPGVAALALAGLVLAILQLGAPSGFLTPYGGVLGLKLLGVAVLIGLAHWNRSRLTPALAEGHPQAGRRLRLSIGIEIALMLAVAGSVAALAHLTPPRALAARSEHHDPYHDHQAKPHFVRIEAEAEGHRMKAAVAGRRAGGHEVMASFTHRDGGPLAPREVELSMSLPTRGIEPILRKMTRTGDAYVFHTADMSLPGIWEIEVVGLVSDFERVRFSAEVAID